MKMDSSQKAKIILFREQGKGYRTISKILDIPLSTVKSFCRRSRLKKEKYLSVMYTAEITHCENCGREIRQIAKRRRKRFCCDKCRNLWWNSHLDLVNRKANYTFRCQHCGKEFHVYGDRRRKYCCRECYIQKEQYKSAIRTARID